MARGKPITVAEGYAIRAMLEEGLGVRKMSQHLGRSET